MRKVMVFKETLLPPSETFILAQMQQLKQYEAVLAGLERASPSLPLPGEPILLSDSSHRLADGQAKMYRRFGIAPFFHARARRARPALLHAHFASGGRTALPLARSLRVPLLVTLHGKDVTVSGVGPDRYRRLAQDAALFICVSRFIHQSALAAGFPAEKLLVHHIGIDRSTFSLRGPAPAAEGVLFVGRLVEKKGCEYLLRAMQLVQRDRPACVLTVIGDGPLGGMLQALASDLGIRCRFLGVQPGAVVREALRGARVFCVPSITAADGDSEGLGMVFAEAQAMGVPVVSTLHGGIPEVVMQGETGLLVPERDSDALAGALSRLLGDEALWQQFHHQAPLFIEKTFDLVTQTEQLENIYTETITRSGFNQVSQEMKPQPLHTVTQTSRK